MAENFDEGADTSAIFRAVVERASKAGLRVELKERLEPTYKQFALIYFKNGRGEHRRYVSELTAPVLAELEFEHLSVLGDFAAVLDHKRGEIEALLSVDASMFLLQKTLAESLSSGDEASSDEIHDSDPEFDSESLRNRWEYNLLCLNDDLKVSIGTASNRLVVANSYMPRMVNNGYIRNSAALRIAGVNLGHDEALELLRDLSNSIFFELDVKSQIPVRLRRTGKLPPERRKVGGAGFVPTGRRYSEEAVALYSYASSSSGMPLLQFLAYYQVAEFFFGRFSRYDLARRVRQMIVDPTFSVDNDQDLDRLIDLSNQSSSGSGRSEREQLRAVVGHCVEPADLSRYLSSDPDREAFFSGKKVIKGVRSISQNDRNNSLSDQVADRLYGLRCRIVHAKSEIGIEKGGIPLLPFTEEADSLVYDIGLMRFIAQKVLISTSMSR